MEFAAYDTITGKLISINSSSISFDLTGLQPFGENSALIELSENSWDYYVDVSVLPHVVVPKSSYNLNTTALTLMADGLDEVTISNIPPGTAVIWPDGYESVIDTGSISFSVDLAGEYAFGFESVAYLDESITITATEV